MIVRRRRIALRQFDALALDLIDGADVLPVRAQHFHMFPDLCRIGHLRISFARARSMRELSRATASHRLDRDDCDYGSIC
jgi:hypothetical protein